MILEGPIQVRVFDYLRLLKMIETDYRNGKRSWSVNPVTEAIRKKYVPASLLSNMTHQARRKAAIEHMTYVKTLLLAGGDAKKYGEEIVVGWITYLETDDCGCPVFRGTGASQFFGGEEKGVMCIHTED